MRTKPIIEALLACTKYAESMDGVCDITVKPGQPIDIAAVCHLATRLSESLDGVKKLIAMEVGHLKGASTATNTKSTEAVTDMLLKGASNA